MKNKKQILDVDFIGGQGALTLVEEAAISEYFQGKKAKIATKKEPKKQVKQSKV